MSIFRGFYSSVLILKMVSLNFSAISESIISFWATVKWVFQSPTTPVHKKTRNWKYYNLQIMMLTLFYFRNMEWTLFTDVHYLIYKLTVLYYTRNYVVFFRAILTKTVYMHCCSIFLWFKLNLHPILKAVFIFATVTIYYLIIQLNNMNCLGIVYKSCTTKCHRNSLLHHTYWNSLL